MDALSTYLIEVGGEVDEDDLNAASPVRVSAAGAGEGRTCLTACTDQSGLIGLLRYLHGLGFRLVRVSLRAGEPPCGE